MFDAVSPHHRQPPARDPHHAPAASRPQASTRPPGGGARQDSQTLTRAFDIVFLVADEGGATLGRMQSRLGLTKSTAYRLASALVKRRLLVRADQVYDLGPKWIELAALAPDSASQAV